MSGEGQAGPCFEQESSGRFCYAWDIRRFNRWVAPFPFFLCLSSHVGSVDGVLVLCSIAGVHMNHSITCTLLPVAKRWDRKHVKKRLPHVGEPCRGLKVRIVPNRYGKRYGMEAKSRFRNTGRNGTFAATLFPVDLILRRLF